MQLRITSRKKFTVLLCALGLISIVAIYPRQTVNFFYSTAIQIKDYIHFYGIRLQFAFIKATEGEKLVDPYFLRNWQLSRENGLLRGAYHYFSPSVSASVQARLFLQTVDFSQGDFPAVLDVEERGKLSAKELRKRVSQWLKMVEKRTGKKPIIYSGAVFYHTNLAGYFNEYPWWVAHYYQRRPDNDGMAWRFWQHSDRGQVDGINGPVDFNVFNGTVEELQAFVDGIK